VPGVRLRTLSEAECYARCYGTRDDAVTPISLPRPLEQWLGPLPEPRAKGPQRTHRRDEPERRREAA
jgi:hypothetical protein